MNELFILERNDTFWKLEGNKDDFLEHNKKLRTIVFWNWNKTTMNSFLEMGNSSSNVPNVIKGSSLTGHRISGY